MKGKMSMKRFFSGLVLGAVLATGVSAFAAITFASAVVPIAAATDARFICYQRDASGWSVSGMVCPVLDPTVVSGFGTVPCQTLTVPIATPSGAVLTDLKAKFKTLVQLNPGACGTVPCPSAD